MPVAALRAGPLAAVVLTLPFLGCGGGSGTGTTHASTARRSVAIERAPSASPELRVAATTALPEAVQLPAVTPGAGGVLAIAGLDAGDSSLASVTLIDGTGARSLAQLPSPLRRGGGERRRTRVPVRRRQRRHGELGRPRSGRRGHARGRAAAGAGVRRGRGGARRHGVRRRRLYRDRAVAHDRRVHPRPRLTRRRHAAATAALRGRRGRRRTAADRWRHVGRNGAAGDPLV